MGARSSIPAPPWHYVGDFLVIEYWAEPDAVRGRAAAGPRAVRRRSRALRRPVRRLAVLLGLRRGAARPGARPVQGVLHRRQRADGRRARHHLPVHLGRQGLRAGPRLDPGLPRRSWARSDARDALASALDCRAEGRTFAGTLAANGRRLAQGTVTPERVSRGRADPQRPAADQPPPLPAAGRGPARRPGRGRAGAGPEPRPLDLHDPRGDGDARAVRRARTRSTPAGAGADGKGFRFHFAYTVDDLETVAEL